MSSGLVRKWHVYLIGRQKSNQTVKAVPNSLNLYFEWKWCGHSDILVMYCNLPFYLRPGGYVEILLAEKLNWVTYQYIIRSWQTRNTSHLWTSLAFGACISPITFSVFAQSFITHCPHMCGCKSGYYQWFQSLFRCRIEFLKDASMQIWPCG